MSVITEKMLTDVTRDFFWEKNYDISLSNIYEIVNGISLKRLIVMIGAANYFSGSQATPIGGIYTHQDELRSLVFYLKSINAHKPSDSNEITYVLAFDKAYTPENIKEDFEDLNKIMYTNRNKNRTSIPFEKDFEENIDEYAFPDYQPVLTEPAKNNLQNTVNRSQYGVKGVSWTYRIGNILFQFFPLNLESSKKISTKELFLMQNKSIIPFGDECKPKANSFFDLLEKYCNKFPFEEYFLYNCAWIGTNSIHINNLTKKAWKRKMPYENVFLELVCEFIYIFSRLKKPSFLLTSNILHGFIHKNEKVSHGLFITPLNDTTKYMKNVWKEVFLKGGKQNHTLKQKKKSRKLRR